MLDMYVCIWAYMNVCKFYSVQGSFICYSFWFYLFKDHAQQAWILIYEMVGCDFIRLFALLFSPPLFDLRCKARSPRYETDEMLNLGLYSLSCKTSYHQISWSLAAEFDFTTAQSLCAADAPVKFQSDMIIVTAITRTSGLWRQNPGVGFRSIHPAERWRENPVRAGILQHIECGIRQSEASPHEVLSQ